MTDLINLFPMLLRGDGRDRTPEQIRTTLAWVRADSFWKSNVLSPEKLREKWDTLQVKIREAQNAKRTSGNAKTTNLSDYIERNGLNANGGSAVAGQRSTR